MKYKLNIKEKEPKLPKEQAIEEFSRMAEHWEFRLSFEYDVDQRDTDGFCDLVIDGLIEGSVSIDHEKMLPVVHSNLGDVKFKEPGGFSPMEMDSKKKDREITKVYAAIGSWCSRPVSDFGKMHPKYINLCMALWALFFG